MDATPIEVRLRLNADPAGVCLVRPTSNSRPVATLNSRRRQFLTASQCRGVACQRYAVPLFCVARYHATAATPRRNASRRFSQDPCVTHRTNVEHLRTWRSGTQDRPPSSGKDVLSARQSGDRARLSLHRASVVPDAPRRRGHGYPQLRNDAAGCPNRSVPTALRGVPEGGEA